MRHLIAILLVLWLLCVVLLFGASMSPESVDHPHSIRETIGAGLDSAFRRKTAQDEILFLAAVFGIPTLFAGALMSYMGMNAILRKQLTGLTGEIGLAHDVLDSVSKEATRADLAIANGERSLESKLDDIERHTTTSVAALTDSERQFAEAKDGISTRIASAKSLLEDANRRARELADGKTATVSLIGELSAAHTMLSTSLQAIEGKGDLAAHLKTIEADLIAFAPRIEKLEELKPLIDAAGKRLASIQASLTAADGDGEFTLRELIAKFQKAVGKLEDQLTTIEGRNNDLPKLVRELANDNGSLEMRVQRIETVAPQIAPLTTSFATLRERLNRLDTLDIPGTLQQLNDLAKALEKGFDEIEDGCPSVKVELLALRKNALLAKLAKFVEAVALLPEQASAATLSAS